MAIRVTPGEREKLRWLVEWENRERIKRRLPGSPMTIGKLVRGLIVSRAAEVEAQAGEYGDRLLPPKQPVVVRQPKVVPPVPPVDELTGDELDALLEGES